MVYLKQQIPEILDILHKTKLCLWKTKLTLMILNAILYAKWPVEQDMIRKRIWEITPLLCIIII